MTQVMKEYGLTLSPLVSRPARPALPVICLYLVASRYSSPTLGCRSMTLLAGRFTPAARVDVAVRTLIIPSLKQLSTASRSSDCTYTERTI